MVKLEDVEGSSSTTHLGDSYRMTSSVLTRRKLLSAYEEGRRTESNAVTRDRMIRGSMPYKYPRQGARTARKVRARHSGRGVEESTDLPSWMDAADPGLVVACWLELPMLSKSAYREDGSQASRKSAPGR